MVIYFNAGDKPVEITQELYEETAYVQGSYKDTSAPPYSLPSIDTKDCVGRWFSS
jgi:hypothetical protein